MYQKLKFLIVLIIYCTFSSIKNTDASFSAIEYFVAAQRRVAVCFNPHSSHGIVKYFVLFEHPESAVVDEHAPVLASPDLVATNNGIATCSDLYS